MDKSEIRQPTQIDLFKGELGTMLKEYWPRGFKPKTIIDVACGMGHEASGIIAALKAEGVEGFELLLIDPDDSSLRAISLFSPELADDPRVRVRKADARIVADGFEDKTWDMVILRNPQVLHGINHYIEVFQNAAEVMNGTKAPPEVQIGGVVPEWETIIRNCQDQLNPGGHLLITTPTQPEMKAVFSILSMEKLEEVRSPQDIQTSMHALAGGQKETMISVLKRK